MQYASPELVVVGRAEVLVLGIPLDTGDNGSSPTSHSALGLVPGLDD